MINWVICTVEIIRSILGALFVYPSGTLGHVKNLGCYVAASLAPCIIMKCRVLSKCNEYRQTFKNTQFK